MYDHVGNQILHEEDKIRSRNTAPVYYPKEDRLLLYCPSYLKHLEEYTKAAAP